MRRTVPRRVKTNPALGERGSVANTYIEVDMLVKANALNKPLVEPAQQRPTKKQIRQWWHTWPRAMIGLPTGLGSGVDVLDIDLQPCAGSHGGDERRAARSGSTGCIEAAHDRRILARSISHLMTRKEAVSQPIRGRPTSNCQMVRRRFQKRQADSRLSGFTHCKGDPSAGASSRSMICWRTQQ
jgi:bifunctional DNA primase/polymerase-like protein